jgi:hypothetical protein
MNPTRGMFDPESQMSQTVSSLMHARGGGGEFHPLEQVTFKDQRPGGDLPSIEMNRMGGGSDTM